MQNQNNGASTATRDIAFFAGLRRDLADHGSYRKPSVHSHTVHTHKLTAILISGDIQLNPGPVKLPCVVRKRAFANSQWTISLQPTRIHVGCCGVSPKEGTHLQNWNVNWYCIHYLLPNFVRLILKTAPYEVMLCHTWHSSVLCNCLWMFAVKQY